MVSAIATETGHWYTADGSPAYTVRAKDGAERGTTLRDARKHHLLPSVTEIIKCAAKPGLDLWKQQQVMLAAMTLPRLDGEDDAAFCQRVIADSREQGKQAAARGSALHGAIECHLQGRSYAADWIPHVDAVLAACAGVDIDLLQGNSEHSFAHASGYGGKVDWHAAGIVLDFKSKPTIDPKLTAYDEQAMQLAAYAQGLGMESPRMLNVFVGINDAKVHIHEWPADAYYKGLRMFNALLDYWQTSKNYRPQIVAKAA